MLILSIKASNDADLECNFEWSYTANNCSKISVKVEDNEQSIKSASKWLQRLKIDIVKFTLNQFLKKLMKLLPI